MGLSLLVGIQLARYLGPAGYGAYGLLMAIVSLAGIIAQFGLPILVVRDAASAIGRGETAILPALLHWYGLRALGIALPVGFGTAAVAWLWLPGGPDLRGITAACVFILSLLALAVAFLRAIGGNLRGQAIDYLLRPAALSVALYLVHEFLAGVTVERAMLAQAIVGGLCMAIALAFARRALPGLSRCPAAFRQDPWVGTAFAYTATGLLFALGTHFPIIVAAVFVSQGELGIFRVAMASLAIVGLPVSVANVTAGPLVAALRGSGDEQALALAIRRSTVAAFACTSAVLLVLAAAGRPLIALLFGGDYVAAYWPLLVLGAGQLVNSGFGIAGPYLNLTGREGLVTRAYALAVPTGMAASTALTPLWGLSGAAAGSVVMAVVWHACLFVGYRREVDVPLSLLAALRSPAR
jgi:O-antigen/teichoic acid export membrane protein